MKILSVPALLLTVLSSASACANKPVEQNVQAQYGSGDGGSGNGGGSSSGGAY